MSKSMVVASGNTSCCVITWQRVESKLESAEERKHEGQADLIAPALAVTNVLPGELTHSLEVLPFNTATRTTKFQYKFWRDKPC